MSLRPDVLPEWATDTNYADPSEDWDGQPNKVEPSSGMKAAGFIPADELGIDYLNYLLSQHAKWLQHVEGRNVTRLHENWIGTAIASATADPIVNFSKWKLTVGAGGGVGLVSTSDDYNGPFVAMSSAGAPVVLETTIPVCRRADDAIVRFDFDVAIGQDFGGGPTDIDNAVIKFGLKDSTTDFAQFFFDQSGSAFWRVQSRNNSATTTDATTVTPAAATYPTNRFSIVLKGANVGDAVEYYIDDVLVETHAGADGPRASANLTVFFECMDDTTDGSALKVGAGQVDWNRR